MPRGIPNAKAATSGITASASSSTSSPVGASSGSSSNPNDEPEFLDIDILSAGTKSDLKTRKRLAAMLEDGSDEKAKKRGRGSRQRKEGKQPRNINASDTVYEIENILDVRWSGSQREYFISWKDYSDKHNSWVAEDCFISSLPIEVYKSHQEGQAHAAGQVGPNQAQRARRNSGYEVDASKAGSGNGGIPPGGRGDVVVGPLTAVQGSGGGHPGGVPIESLPASLESMTHAALQKRLLRRSLVEAVLSVRAPPGVEPTPGNDGIAALIVLCVGLFVRLKVESAYCVAQILEITQNPEVEYQFGNGSTSLHLLVSFDTDKTLARFSYISDGPEITPAEYETWKSKRDSSRLAQTMPAASMNLQMLQSTCFRSVPEWPPRGACR